MTVNLTKTKYGDFIGFHDEIVFKCLQNGDFWDQHLIPTFEKFVTPDSIVVEVGANLGFHTVNLSKKSKKVYAFEPQKTVYWQLCANLLLNQCFNTSTFNNVVSNSKEQFIVPNVSVTNNFRYAATLSMEKGTGVESVCLDDIIKEKVDFIKVDAQGADLAVLQGANLLINNYRPVICFEYDQHTSLKIYDHKWKDYLTFFQQREYQITDYGNACDFLAIPQ